MDRAIRTAAPQWGARRARARVQLHQIDAIQRSTEKRFNGDNWRVNDPNDRVRGRAAKTAPMDRLTRDRIRRTFKLNPFARKAMGSLLNNIVGFGITGSPVKSPSFLKAWNAWTKVCDWDGVEDFYALQRLIVRTWLLDGEVFIVKRIDASSTQVNPLRLQVLSVDQLDTGKTGENIRHGIEYVSGRPVAYWFRKSLEDVDSFDPANSERIETKHVKHLFVRDEPGQWRGSSHFEPVIDALDGIDDYLEAEGVRKRMESCFVGFVAQNLGDEEFTVGQKSSVGMPVGDGQEARVESFYPGMISYGQPGERMSFGEPKAAGGLTDYLRWGGLRIAAGAQVTYEGVTGDLSNVNFSSYRAGANEFKLSIGAFQWLGLIPRLLVWVWDAWCEAGLGSGRHGARFPEMKWTPPPFQTISRLDDAKADLLEMQIGVSSRREKVNERGQDFETHLKEVGDDTKAQKDLGLAFLGDPLSPAQLAKPAAQRGSGGTITTGVTSHDR
jgi:lambda family phage portal protein